MGLLASAAELIGEKAEKAGAKRIPGDGDGDGIAYENRDKAGKKLGKPALATLLGAHRGMSLTDESMARNMARAAASGNADRVAGMSMSGATGKAFKAAVLAAMQGSAKPAAAPPKAEAPKPEAPPQPKAAAPASKPAARVKPAAAAAARKAANDTAHKATTAALDARQKEAMLNYTGAMFRDLNPRLRAGKGPAPADKADLTSMDAAFAKASTSEAVTLYRGVQGDFAAKLKVGSSFQDGGFTSASSDKGAADVFARSSRDAVLEIRVPKGSKAISVRELSQFGKSEQEVVLNRGGTFKVVQRTEAQGDNPAQIVLEYVG